MVMSDEKWADYLAFCETLPPCEKVVKVSSATFIPGAGSYFVSDDDLAKMVKNPDGSFTEFYS